MEATEKMVKFILGTKEKDLPPEMFNIVKLACLDNIGTMIAGSTQPLGKIMTEYVKERGGTPEATLVGTGVRTQAAMAALAYWVIRVMLRASG